MAAIAELEVVLHRLGVDPDSEDADDVARLLNAVSKSFRRRTNRGFEGEPTTYTETVMATEFGELLLTHTPVQSITSLTALYADNTPGPIVATSDYHVDRSERGLVLLHQSPAGQGRPYRRRYSVVYTVTGDITAEAQQAVEDWVAARWADRSRDPRLASYSTGADSESYDTRLAGMPPAEVAEVISGLYVSLTGAGGGVI